MAHPAQSARKGNNYVPNDYRPFQCCPTKLERQTRVPKMSAQKLSHKKDSNEQKKPHKSQFEFGSSSDSGSKKHDAKPAKSNDSKFGTTSPVPSSSPSKRSSSSSSSNTASAPSRSKKSRTDLDDDDDDVPVKDIKKSSKPSKETNKPKPGQKGLLGIAKIVNWF